MANEEEKKVPALPPGLIAKLAAGIAKSQVGGGGARGGATLLRLLTSGSWVFGQQNDVVQEGSKWLVAIQTFKHGHCVWHESQLVAEVMVEMWNDAPEMPMTHPTGSPYKAQISVEMKCMNGEDAGQQVLYKTTSLGGTSALFDLKSLVARKLEEDATNPFVFPVLELGTTSYPNKRHGGTTYVPVLEVVGWGNIEGELEGAQPKPKAGNGGAAETPPKPQKPKKPSLREASEAKEEGDTVAAEGQRRRPNR